MNQERAKIGNIVIVFLLVTTTIVGVISVNPGNFIIGEAKAEIDEESLYIMNSVIRYFKAAQNNKDIEGGKVHLIKAGLILMDGIGIFQKKSPLEKPCLLLLL